LSTPDPGSLPRAAAPRDEAPLADTPGSDTPADKGATGAAPYDPLRLCIFATIALLGWLGGPWILALFAALGFAGYWRARRGGLLTSRCFLRDTRLVLTYLALLFVAAGYGIWLVVVP
jgi:hypothetical protein